MPWLLLATTALAFGCGLVVGLWLERLPRARRTFAAGRIPPRITEAEIPAAILRRIRQSHRN